MAVNTTSLASEPEPSSGVETRHPSSRQRRRCKAKQIVPKSPTTIVSESTRLTSASAHSEYGTNDTALSVDEEDTNDTSDAHVIGPSGDDRPIGEDKEMPEGPTVTRAETWAYYLYYNGDNGVGPNGYSRLLFQSLATAAAVNTATGQPCTGGVGEVCLLPFLGQRRSVASIALIADGVSFGLMALLFTTIGSAADYGDVSRYVLLLATVLCWGTQYAFLAVWRPEQWVAALALYMVGFVSYGVTLVFYASAFPRLARNTPSTKAARRALEAGTMAGEEYATVEMLERNRLSSISTAHSNWGYLAVLGLNLSILLPESTRSLPKINNYALALTNTYWVLLGLPWFLLQKRRPGPQLPRGAHWLTVGWKQIAQALAQHRELPYTFAYLGGFFLLADGLNTTGTLVGIVQNAHVRFSFLSSTYLGMAQAGTSIFSCYACWWVQRRWCISTKRMFQATNCVTVLVPLWGMLGLWTQRVGFHNTWEFWLYNVVFGLGQAPYYAYAQSMMADLTPPGFEGMWFGLFGITNRASSLLGPNVCAVIIDRTGNTWAPFVFLFIICLSAALVITCFVSMEKGHRDAVEFAVRRRGKVGDVVGVAATDREAEDAALRRPLAPNDTIVG